MRVFFILYHGFSVAFASSAQSTLLNVSLSLENAFAGVLPTVSSTPETQDPTPRLIMYAQTFTDTSGNPLSLLPLLEYDTKITHIILGSIHLHEQPGTIMLNNEPPGSEAYDILWREVKILQSNGVKVMALLGGAAPGTYSRLSGSDEKFLSYYRPLLNLIRKHKLDGLDIDIEERVPLSTPLRLLRQLHTDLGSEFLLTMAPMATAMSEDDTALSGFSYRTLDKLAISKPKNNRNATRLISWFNVQCHAGYARSASMYNSIIAAGYEAERVVMGVTTSKAGYVNGFTSLKKLGKVVKELREIYGNTFGGAAGWEYWDAGRDDADMGMREGGEPWRWVMRVSRAVFGSENGKRKGRGNVWGGECWKRCLREDS